MQGLGGPPSPEEVEAKLDKALEGKTMTPNEALVLMNRPMANDLVLRDLHIVARPIRYFKKHAMLSQDGWKLFHKAQKKLEAAPSPEIRRFLRELVINFGH